MDGTDGTVADSHSKVGEKMGVIITAIFRSGLLQSAQYT